MQGKSSLEASSRRGRQQISVAYSSATSRWSAIQSKISDDERSEVESKAGPRVNPEETFDYRLARPSFDFDHVAVVQVEMVPQLHIGCDLHDRSRMVTSSLLVCIGAKNECTHSEDRTGHDADRDR